jgi:diadenosine tetraphosphatase ApaH/serine/threonine PP2A family protein phosphatase
VTGAVVRYLILSDLHANWEALDAVLRHAAGRWDQVFCCGDLAGYGADPNAVVEWARAHCAAIVRGNHDKACAGVESAEWFNPKALAAALWTRAALTEENRAFVYHLPKGPLALDGFELSHGSPCDEDEYLSGASAAEDAFDYLARRVAFFGHTHVHGGYIWNHARVEAIARPPLGAGERTLVIDPECAYLVNPGSVGQPRDGDPRAAYALYDAGAATIAHCRVAYDVAAAQRKIRAAGLPEILADRLRLGR